MPSNTPAIGHLSSREHLPICVSKMKPFEITDSFQNKTTRVKNIASGKHSRNRTLFARPIFCAGGVPVRKTGLTQYRILFLQMSVYVIVYIKCRRCGPRPCLFIGETSRTFQNISSFLIFQMKFWLIGSQ